MTYCRIIFSFKNHRQIFNDEFLANYLRDYQIKTDNQRLKEVNYNCLFKLKFLK